MGILVKGNLPASELASPPAVPQAGREPYQMGKLFFAGLLLPQSADQRIGDPCQCSRPHDPHEEEEGDSIEISFHNDNIYWLR